ncbi:hypothetical protein ACFQY5_18735 [Paeniroseomonas aquatica]
MLRLIASPGHHSDLRYAAALAPGVPACDAAFDCGYASMPLRAAFAAEAALSTPDPSEAWSIHSHGIPCSMPGGTRRELLLRARGLCPNRPATRQDTPSSMGFAHLAATADHQFGSGLGRRE